MVSLLFFEGFGIFTKHFRYVVAGWVAFKEVACVVFGACSASAADFSVLANSTFALKVALVTQL